MELKVDPERTGFAETGIYVRALANGSIKNMDIAELDRDSLLAWMRASQRGMEQLGEPSVTFAESLVLALLGHER